ncbi:helix-turn-helix domain-containing protein [Streptacidiphilus albus]|uniref:helix-turn-helix domain-containing protein n=1 Tax=Streptacidiphilus albus TaxID=105425 RepID=UPI00054BB1A6|nr:helix-turn-helix transcriptional regulator [Streptacidiphilus albus]
MESTEPTAGENIAVLRKARDLSQARLAREMGITVSYLSKIEVGLRPATPPIVAAAAKALRVSTARIYGQPFAAPNEQGAHLENLRGAVRRYNLPKFDVPAPDQLAASLAKLAELRTGTHYSEMLRVLPRLLGEATATAYASDGDAVAWGQVADAYGCAYAVAHRLGQPDLAEMVVSRQAWASHQTWNPEAEAATAWNEAGTYQSAGDYGDGLAVVDRAIVQFESASRGEEMGPEKLVPLGSLHLRGVVLASRAKDKLATEAHATHAAELARRLNAPKDVLRHNLTFGAGNTVLYQLAAHIELGNPQEADDLATPLLRKPPAGLTPNRTGRLYIDTARARLALDNLSGAEEALKEAFRVAPQMAEVHPMAREVVRVLMVMHQRSRPELVAMAKRSGLA